MDNRESGSFSYTYSADVQNEVKRIRDKYIPREEDKMQQLKRLDGGTVKKATGYSLSAGIIGALMLGGGMSCTMVFEGAAFIPGIFIGVLGMAVAAAAFPLYRRVLKKEREKIAPQITKLCDELIK